MTAPGPDAFYVDMDCCCEIAGDGTPEKPYAIARCDDHAGPARTLVDGMAMLSLALVCLYFVAHVAYALWTGGWHLHG